MQTETIGNRNEQNSPVSNRDWSALADQFSSAPFPSICLDDFLSAEFADEVAGSYPKYEDAQVQGFEFQAVNERKKVQITDPDLFPGPVRNLATIFASDEFIKNIETLSGISDLVWDSAYSGGGMHLTGSSGHLDVHVDFNYEEKMGMHRRLNLLLYLNDEWRDEWGGELELWDDDVKHCFSSVAPRKNRCVIFETSDRSYHGVTAVNCPDTTTRNSFAVYYYTKQAPVDWNGKKHDTIFKARPDELAKKYIHMPLHAVKTSYIFQKFEGVKRRVSSLFR